MPRVQIFSLARLPGCRGKKKCAIVSNTDRLKPVYSETIDADEDDFIRRE